MPIQFLMVSGGMYFISGRAARSSTDTSFNRLSSRTCVGTCQTPAAFAADTSPGSFDSSTSFIRLVPKNVDVADGSW